MSSKYSNKYPIPEKFPEILHDFSREVLRYMPKDILDFSIQYFYSLETNSPLNYTEGGSNKIPKISETIELKEKRNDLSTPSLTTNQNTQNVFYNKAEKKIHDENEDIKEIKETNSSKINSRQNSEENQESKHSGGSGVVRASINFVNDIFESSHQKLKTMNLEENNENDNKFNISGHTFSDVSGNTEDKNAVKNFVGDIFDESKKNPIES